MRRKVGRRYFCLPPGHNSAVALGRFQLEECSGTCSLDGKDAGCFRNIPGTEDQCSDTDEEGQESVVVHAKRALS